MFQNNGSFQAALFSFADLRRKKGFLLAESSFFSFSQQKKKKIPLEKNLCFGTCKPANPQAELTDAALVAVVPTTQYGYRQVKIE